VANKIFEISSLDNVDFINICAQFVSLLRGEKDNLGELRARGYTEKQLASMQKTKVVSDVTIQNIRFTRPLTDFKYSKMGYVLTLLDQYEKGNMPFPGSVSEQPAQIMEIFNLLQGLKQDYRASLEKQQASKVAPPTTTKSKKRK
jgi:hypothetical protein